MCIFLFLLDPEEGAFIGWVQDLRKVVQIPEQCRIAEGKLRRSVSSWPNTQRDLPSHMGGSHPICSHHELPVLCSSSPHSFGLSGQHIIEIFFVPITSDDDDDATSVGHPMEQQRGTPSHCQGDYENNRVDCKYNSCYVIFVTTSKLDVDRRGGHVRWGAVGVAPNPQKS